MASGQNNIPEIKVPIAAAPSPLSAAKPKAGGGESAASRVEQGPDTVQLSPRAREASALRGKVEASPEVRPARVEEARARLQNGAPNSAALNAKLAEKLLTEN